MANFKTGVLTMQRLAQAGTAIAAASLFGAYAPSLTGVEGSSLEAARGLNGNAFFEADITEVNGRAVGTVERVYLDQDGEVEALKIRWRAGWTHQPFALVQSVDRFSYDPDMNVLVADARIERLREWAEADARDISTSGGLPLNRVGEGVLAGARVVAANGEPLGRLVSVETGSTGEIVAITTVEQSGWFNARSERRTWPITNAHWQANERTIELSTVQSS